MAKLCLSVLWKVEHLRDELQYLAEEISKQRHCLVSPCCL